jgi:pimeloyl-ACP methyl ester carboxylesterase
MLPALAQAGYRGIAVAMRGYEPSSVPADGDYGAMALAEDVFAWMDALKIERAHLVGHDWGASVVCAAAGLNPARVASLSMLSVPHPGLFAAVGLRDFGQVRRSWYMFFFQMRGLADWALARNDWAFVKMLYRHWSPGWTPDPSDLRAVLDCFARPGVAAAALQYYRTAFNTKAPRQAEGAALFAKPVMVPTLGLCGETDGCISADIFARCMEPSLFPSGLTVKRIAGAGHFLQLEKPVEVNAAVIDFLNGLPPSAAS